MLEVREKLSVLEEGESNISCRNARAISGMSNADEFKWMCSKQIAGIQTEMW